MGHWNKQEVLENYTDCQRCGKSDNEAESIFSLLLLLALYTNSGDQTESGYKKYHQPIPAKFGYPRQFFTKSSNKKE